MAKIYTGGIEKGLEALKRSKECAQKSFLSEYGLSALIYEFYCAAFDHDPQVLNMDQYPADDFESEPLLYCYALQIYRLIKKEDYSGALTVLEKLNKVVNANCIYHWQSASKFFESYIHYCRGHYDIADRLLSEGTEILNKIHWDIYPAAVSMITAYIITRLITTDNDVELAGKLLSTLNNKSVLDSIRDADKADRLSPEQKHRIIKFASEHKLRGLLVIAKKWSEENHSDLSNAATLYIQHIKALPAPAIDIITLGGFRATIDGNVISFTRQKSKELFLWLLLEHPKPVHEEVIMEYFWPETDPRKAKSNLQTTISSLRKSLDVYSELDSQAYIEYNSSLYSIKIPEYSQIDFIQFTKYSREFITARTAKLQSSDSQEEIIKSSLDLYTGDLLPELYYEEFSSARREELRSLYFNTLDKYIAAMIANSNFESAEYYAKAGLRIDPLWSNGIKFIMTIYLKTDKIVNAMKAYRKYERQLADDLGLRPPMELSELFTQLQSH